MAHSITTPWFASKAIVQRYLLNAKPYMTGRLLDAGCGNQMYRGFYDCSEYVGLEWNEKFSPDYVGDVRDMPFGEAEFDSILNSQVLEHVDDTHSVISEFFRVLKPGGHLCITVPFVARLHGIPHDYWRMSSYGLRYLLERHGFEEIQIGPMGGFLTTQAYLWQFFIWDTFARNKLTKLLRKCIMPFSNILFLMLHKIDWDESTPFNFYAIARKPQSDNN